nr:MAG TPA: hypothetical protein [Caudoviricetes sp.]
MIFIIFNILRYFFFNIIHLHFSLCFISHHLSIISLI